MYPQAILSFTLPDGEKKSVPLRPDEPVLIGRNRASTIKLNLPSVSRQHAKIIYERDVFWIEDLGSSNGTFVNQKQVQKARISIGDVLKCGDFVIAVRNHSDRSSINPSHQHDNRKLSDPPRMEMRSPIGQRRDSLQPAQPSREPSQVKSWHSKAPTHGPQATEGQHSAAPVPPRDSDAQAITALPRTESLSLAFGDAKPKDVTADYQHNGFASRGPTQQVSPQFMQTADDPREAELVRLKQAEDALLNELNFQTQQLQTLQQQVQESNERIANLESDLDQQSQQYDQLKQALEHSGQTADEALQTAELEIERLQNEQSEFLKERTLHQEKLENAKSEHAQELSQTVDKLNQAQAEIQRLTQELQNDALAIELEELKQAHKRLLAASSNRRNETEVHVYSLAQPNRHATQPDWAKFKAKQDQLIDEIHTLKVQLARLEHQASFNQQDPVSTRPSLLERVSLEESLERESEQTMSQGVHESSLRDSQANDSLGSSANTRRTWRGML